MTSFLMPNGTPKFQREDRERGCQIREGYEKTPFSATAGIVFRFTRWRCYCALTVALAGLSCFSKFSGPVYQIPQLTAANFPRVAMNFLRPLDPTEYAVLVTGK